MSDHYTYRVAWSAQDEEYVSTVAEFPSLSWLDEDDMKALQGLKQLVTDVVQDLRTNSEPVPEPLADRAYSGKFQVRITPFLHRQLATEAAEQKVSLNRLVAAKLAAPLGAPTVTQRPEVLGQFAQRLKESPSEGWRGDDRDRFPIVVPLTSMADPTRVEHV